MANLKEKREEFKKTGKEVAELRKKYAEKYMELRKDYFNELKEILPEKKMPDFKKGDINPEEFFKAFPKPVFLMDDEEKEELKKKRKEFFEKAKDKDLVLKFFEMLNSKKDED